MSSRLDQLVNRLASEAVAYKSLAVRAGECEAEHKKERAKSFLRARAEGGTVGDAEAKSEADPVVSDLYAKRLSAAAVADSQKELIRSLRAAIDAEQTNRADMRAADVAAARGFGGAS